MAIELFLPFLIKKIFQCKLAKTIIGAKTILKNQLETTLSGSGAGIIGELNYANDIGLNKTFEFFVRANATMTITNLNVQYKQLRTELVGGAQDYALYYFHSTSATLTLGGAINVNGNIPDMTVSDFVKGVLKEFNLTIAPITQTSFELMPLEDWYSKGRIIDITKHTDIDSIDIQRVPLYKRISFKYQQSESFMNGQFSDTFGREYGSLEQTYDYDGAEYLVESPFENLLHNKFTGTDLQVGYCINRNWGKYIPKPMLLYMAEQKTCNFKFNNGSSVATLTNYMPFGQDTYANGQYYS
jgi:hypothetical protein